MPFKKLHYARVDRVLSYKGTQPAYALALGNSYGFPDPNNAIEGFYGLNGEGIILPKRKRWPVKRRFRHEGPLLLESRIPRVAYGQTNGVLAPVASLKGHMHGMGESMTIVWILMVAIGLGVPAFTLLADFLIERDEK